MDSEMIVTIDGPVASGKSTAARNVARGLGFEHLDTGALYRAVTLAAITSGISPDDEAAVRRLLARTAVRLEGVTTFLDGKDVSDAIRRPEVSAAVKPFAENPEVREFVNAYARRFAQGRNVVVEGRDMGTVVFPDADLKIFLTACDQERARRRWEELTERGTPQAIEQVLGDLRKRDEADTARAVAPLKMAPDAIKVDSTGWTSEETARRLVELAKDRLEGR